MIKGIKHFLLLLLRALQGSMRDRWDKLAATLTYYTFLSIGPLVVAGLAGAAKVLGITTPQQQVEQIIGNFFHPKLMVAMKNLVAKDFNLGEDQIFTMKVVAIISMAYGALGYASAVKYANEAVWGKGRRVIGVKSYFKRKGKSLLVLLVIMVLVLLALVAAYNFPQLSRISSPSPIVDALLWPVRNLIMLVGYFLLSLFYFIYFPTVKIKWRNAIPGAILSAILNVAGREILRVYLDTHAEHDITVSESILLMMFWMYYAGLILVFTAEFNRMYLQSAEHFNIHEGEENTTNVEV